ncbi:uncharacterized protein LOC23687958 [Aedes aegypti]|uniref:Chitin-binding type-2 domain-containing protein n=1 Tax=Aedes aegypti TaxID=7159 RepID=A0A1S4F293_AEDAE|nr:uncharacterized protein LOC5575310 [Aedes aegypti]XP_011493626.2 uncharacterized protein LOC23687958 [Aedes aegypti]
MGKMRFWCSLGLLMLIVGIAVAHSSEECDDSHESCHGPGDGGNNGGGGDNNTGGESGEKGDSERPSRCKNKPDGTLLPSYDCSMFIVCEGEKELEEDCRPAGTMFDPEREVCDYPENVKCWEGDLCAGKSDGAVVPSDDCQYFIVCNDGRLGDEYKCVPDGTLFDYQRGVCDYPDNVICWGSEGPNTCEGRPDGALAPAIDCSKYVVCQGGEKGEEVQCLPEGTVFDHIREVCDYPENAICWEAGGGGSGGGSNATTALPPTRPPLDGEIPKDICKGIIIDILPHPTDCTKYIVCVMGQPTVESCDEDEIFYPSIGVCGYGNTETCEGDEKWLMSYLTEHNIKSTV